MQRTSWGLALVFVFLATGAFSAVQRPAVDGPRGGGAEARALVKQLEAQVETQRAALKQAEANLEQARGLLSTLEKGNPNTERLAGLRADEERLKRNLEEFKRKVRDPHDPALAGPMRKLSLVRKEIEGLEAK